MREILHRAKMIDSENWVYGNYVRFETRQPAPIGDKLAEDEIMHLIANLSFADWNMPRNLTFHKIKSETVGQFTGLTDKNGVKIFEGDIVRLCAGEYCYGIWEYDSTFEVSDIRSVGLDFANYEEIYVICNIHDKEV